MAQLNVITLSHPTYVGPSGATAAATYSFFSKDYKPPAQPRAVETDVVINQNGKFKYVYDNGPGFRQWQPFSVKCEDSFRDHLGVDAATQYARLRELWEYPGVFGMRAPEGPYLVHWSDHYEQNFRVFPHQVGDQVEYDVSIQVEEGQ
jgi:hypothetical protein